MTWEHFEHTADLGLRVRAPDLPTLLAEAGRGLFAMLVDNLDDVRPTDRVEIEVAGSDPEYLLFDWLAELLAIFDTRRLLLSRFEVRVDPSGARATAWGEPIDPRRHHMAHEVKAITYHGLK
ncbi:MAG: archease, partial [candidate division NC10 bacterium]|nr:archease [candidate division NC10 bacterium]